MSLVTHVFIMKPTSALKQKQSAQERAISKISEFYIVFPLDDMYNLFINNIVLFASKHCDHPHKILFCCCRAIFSQIIIEL